MTEKEAIVHPSAIQWRDDDAILFPYPAISAEEDRQVSEYIDRLHVRLHGRTGS